MPIHTVTQVGRTSGGVILPKDELRHEGLIDENGDVVEYPVLIDYEGDGAWRVELIDPDDYPDVDRQREPTRRGRPR